MDKRLFFVAIYSDRTRRSRPIERGKLQPRGRRRAISISATSYVLASPQAVEMGIFVVGAFVRMRELAATHRDLAKRLDELEQTAERLALSHDTFSRNTRLQLKQLFDAVRELMTPPEPKKRPIGFVQPEEKAAKK